MKRTKKIIEAWTLTGVSATEMLKNLKDNTMALIISQGAPTTMKMAMEAMLSDVIDLAKSKEQKTEAAS
jgi:predicted O-methyltransferase YrrM